MANPTMSNKEPIFTTFKRLNVRYLAIPTDTGGVHIIDEQGWNHGAFKSIQSFKTWRSKTDQNTILGPCKLAVRLLGPSDMSQSIYGFTEK